MTRRGVDFPRECISRRWAIAGARPTPPKSRLFLPGRWLSLTLLDTGVYLFSARPAGLKDPLRAGSAQTLAEVYPGPRTYLVTATENIWF